MAFSDCGKKLVTLGPLKLLQDSSHFLVPWNLLDGNPRAPPMMFSSWQMKGFFGWDSLLGSRNNPGDDDPASHGPTQNVGEEHATLHATSFDVAQPWHGWPGLRMCTRILRDEWSLQFSNHPTTRNHYSTSQYSLMSLEKGARRLGNSIWLVKGPSYQHSTPPFFADWRLRP